MEIVRRLPLGALLMLPAALTVYLSFNGGGFFVEAPSIAAVAVALALAIRAATARRPFAGLGIPAAIVTGGLALYTLWTLLSATWSDAPSRALLEANRALLYLLVFVLFASLPSSAQHMRWIVRWLALGIGAVGLIALTTRLAPDVWPIGPNIYDERLSYPLTYWNALGLLAALASLLCLHLTASSDEPFWVRLAAAGAVPLMASALLLTFSRGAIVACALGLVVYLLVGGAWRAWPALAAVAPTTAVALVVCYRADLLASPDYTTAAGVAEGHDVALVIGLCAAGAIGIRAGLDFVERRLARSRGPARWDPRRLAAVLVLSTLTALAVATPLADAPGYVERQYERFVEGETVPIDAAPRERLTNLSNNGRSDHWRVALDRFRESPFLGEGAGTYRLSWATHRPGRFTVNDAHSLYIEVLGELGAVGLVLLALAIGTLIACLARRARGVDRRPYAVALAVVLAWAAHAGVDWDWEMPALTLMVFALGGAGLAAAAGQRRLVFAPPPVARVGLTLFLLGLAVTPALLVVSQRHLDRSISALKRWDCEPAIDAALSSLSAVSVRPEPWEVIGYCDARLGHERLSVRAFEEAAERDPGNWEVHYGLAVVRGIAGLDPRREARQALRLNPNEAMVQAVVRRFRANDPASWRRAGLRARPAIQ